MTLLLASWLFTQTWAWDEVPGATSYRICWSRIKNAWCLENCRVYDASVCINGKCQGFVPKPTWKLTFFVVTAINDQGESDTEHGPVATCQ